jgi:hypothetical protein
VSISGASSLSLRTSAWLHDNVIVDPIIRHHAKKKFMYKRNGIFHRYHNINDTSREEEEGLKRVSLFRECLDVVYLHPCRTAVVRISFQLRAARFPRVNTI